MTKQASDHKSGLWGDDESQKLDWIVRRWLARPEIQSQADREGMSHWAGVGVQWSQVAREHGTRNSKQCRERWDNHLRPDLRRDRITIENDGTRIMNFVAMMGNRWAEIGRILGRPENAVKNFGYMADKKQKKAQAAVEKVRDEMFEAKEKARRKASQHSRHTSISSMPSLCSDHGSSIDPKSPYAAAPAYPSGTFPLPMPPISEMFKDAGAYPPALPHIQLHHRSRPSTSEDCTVPAHVYQHRDSLVASPIISEGQQRSRPSTSESHRGLNNHPFRTSISATSPLQTEIRYDDSDSLAADTLWSRASTVLDQMNGRTDEQRRRMMRKRYNDRRQDRSPRRPRHVETPKDLEQWNWCRQQREALPGYFELVKGPA